MGNDRSDAMIARLEGELEERNAFIEGVIGSAQDADRDLTENETELVKSARSRVEALREQLDTLSDTRASTLKVRERAAQLHRDMAAGRRQIDQGAVEYRSAGAYVLDMYQAAKGDRDAQERLEIFTRAADHLKTGDIAGTVPDPIVGDVINFIDAARPIVGQIGIEALPSASWHRSKVTQHTAVGRQGTNGGAADEKTELVSQKLVIERINAAALTYGGYVNVSRQSIDFGEMTLDKVIQDLAAQYAIETEAGAAAELATTTTAPVTYAPGDQDALASAIWSAAATAYSAVKGQGRLVLAISPDRLSTFGPLFAPYGPQNQQGTGFSAGSFGQGVMGNISGVPVVMSSALTAGESYLFSTAAVEAYETRVGALQVVEPSVLGTQVGYSGYFTPLMIEDGGVVPVNEGA